MKCTRCGGPAPIEGEVYRHYWPCGCAVTPDRVYSECYRETIWYSHGLGIWQSHPTREGAIAAWRAALGPYRAPKPIEYYTGATTTYKTGEWVYINIVPPTLPTPAEIGRAVRDAEARGARYLDGPPPLTREAPTWTPVPVPVAQDVFTRRAPTVEAWSKAGCPCCVCGTWAVVHRDPTSDMSVGTCTCGIHWQAFDKETSAQRRRRLGP